MLAVERPDARATGRSRAARRRQLHRCRAARSPPSWAPTARARPRCCAPSPGCTAPQSGTRRARRRATSPASPAEQMPGARARPRARGSRRDHRAHRRGEPAARWARSRRQGRPAPTSTGSTTCSPRWPTAARAPAHTLSGGERQMLVIGRALMAEPDAAAARRALAGLAPRIVAQIFALLRDLVAATRASPSCSSSRTPAARSRSPTPASCSTSAGWSPTRDAADAGRRRPAPPRLPRLLTTEIPCSSS